MELFFWVSVGLASVSAFVSIFLHYYIYSFLNSSGILAFTNSIIFLNLFSLALTITLISVIYILQTNSSKCLLTTYAFVAAINGFLSFYLGFRFTFNPSIFLSDIYPNWRNQTDVNAIEVIQNKFKCCGFYKVNELPKDECVFKKPNSCLFSMAKHLGPSITKIGVLFIINFVILLVAAVLFVIESNDVEKFADGSIAL